MIKPITLLANKTLVKEVILYGLIGGCCALLDASIYLILARHVGLNEFLSNLISVHAGIILSFILNSYLNFKKTNSMLKRAISFFSVGYMGLLISMFILWLGVSLFKLDDFLVKIVSIGIVAAFQFILNKIITFGKIK